MQRLSRVQTNLLNIRDLLRVAWQAQPLLFTITVVLQLIKAVLPVANAWVVKLFVDTLVMVIQGDLTGDFVTIFLPVIALQVGLNIFLRVLNSLKGYIHEDLGNRLNLLTETLYYEALGRFDGLQYFESPQFHDTLRIAREGINISPMFTFDIAMGILGAITTLLSFIGVVLVLSPALALILVLASIPQLVMRLRIGTARHYRWREWTPKERRAYYLGELLSEPAYVKETRLFNLSRYILGQFQGLHREIHAIKRRQLRTEIRINLFMDVVYAVTSGLALVVVIAQAFAGLVTAGTVTLYITSLEQFQTSLFWFIDSIAQLHERLLFFGSFRSVRELPNDIPAPETPQSVPPLRQGVELKNVTFRYLPDSSPVLNEINLTIPAGKTVALVGLNGAGKTTLVKLLMRLYDPENGQILWDGVDLRRYPVSELREHTGTIFQDFVHYDLTVRENIGLGNVVYIDNLPQIQQVATDTGVHPFINTLKEGYETVLSRWIVEDGDGAELSGGQWQRIALARMYMRDADFLILDEPTAALDAEAEYEIYSHFARLLKDRTALLISHRFSTVRMADLIAVLEDGKITEFGTHQELMAAGKSYARLYMLQADQYK